VARRLWVKLGRADHLPWLTYARPVLPSKRTHMGHRIEAALGQKRKNLLVSFDLSNEAEWMGIHDLWLFLAVGLLLNITPGPDGQIARTWCLAFIPRSPSAPHL
jgi:hypothetical protein